jgi:hypothetical protein
MASENQRNPHDLGPNAPVLPPLEVQAPPTEGQPGGMDYEVEPAGLSTIALWRWRRAHRDHATAPVRAASAPTYPDVEAPLPVTSEISEPATEDETIWRIAVMHTLGKPIFQLDTLQKYLHRVGYEADDSMMTRMYIEMQNRGIIGRPGKMGAYVQQKHGDAPEAIRSVALHLAQVRNRKIQNGIDHLEADYQANRARGMSEAEARTAYNQGTQRLQAEEIDYTDDIVAARKSLNIPIPEMHRIINKLEHVGFLGVPITNRGANFDTTPGNQTEWYRNNRKWAQYYPQYDRSGSRTVPASELSGQQDSLGSVYNAFPAPFDPQSVDMPQMRRNQRYVELGLDPTSQNDAAANTYISPADLSLIDDPYRDSFKDTNVERVAEAISTLIRQKTQSGMAFEDAKAEAQQEVIDDEVGPAAPSEVKHLMLMAQLEAAGLVKRRREQARRDRKDK